MFQSLVLYRLYPYVIEQLDEMTSGGSRVGLRIYLDGCLRRVDCHIVDSSDVKSVCLGAVPTGENWESCLIHVVFATLCCLDVVSSVGMICVEDCVNVCRAIASAVSPTEPVVIRVYDLQWLRDVMRRKFISQFGGLEPYSLLDVLKFRLVGVMADHRFNKMPEIRRVSI